MLATGKPLYVDDLVTDNVKRSSGFGSALFFWLADYARNAGCNILSLDSGTHRSEAHRFYFRQRMKITDFHFELHLSEGKYGA